MAVLIATLVRLAFDVEVDPTGCGIAIGGTEGLNGLTNRPLVVGRDWVQLYALEPSLPSKCAAAADGEKDLIPLTAGYESERQVRPRLCATERFRVDIEGHRCHGERGAGGNRRAVEVVYLERLGTDPTAQFIALAHGERYCREADARVLRERIPFDAEGSFFPMQDAGIWRGRATNDGPFAMSLLKRR